MSDEIIQELWQIKDNIAREYGYDIEALAAHLQTKKKPEGRRVVDLRARRRAAEQGAYQALETLRVFSLTVHVD